MKAALIDGDNTVLNVIVWSDDCATPSGTFAFVIEDNVPVAPGWEFADGQFSVPIPPPTIPLTELFPDEDPES